MNTNSGANPHHYWAKARVLIHELGHNLSLEHTMLQSNGPCNANEDDGIADTPTIPEVLATQPQDPCNNCGEDPFCTNNLMDYNGFTALTPQQLAHVHHNIINNKLDFVVDDYCTYDPSNTKYVVNGQVEVWNDAKVLDSDLIIEAGGDLTIKCWVHLPQEASVIIEPGGILTVDGGSLINLCDDFWAGIEVWGDNNQNQFTQGGQLAQGKLVLKNGAVIENAREAIQVWEPGNWSSFGGIVQANGATFKNCRRTASFGYYQNYTPGGGSPVPNQSYFANCHFVVDNDYLGVDDFEAHVTMWDNDGVDFIGCKFENLQTNITESHKLGEGILSLDCNYTVRPGCSSNILLNGTTCPGQNVIPSEFRGLNHGIEVRGSGSTNSVRVHGNLFENNIAGIYANATVGLQVRENQFIVGDRNVVLTHPDQDGWYGRHRAIFTTDGYAFAIDDNTVQQSGTDFTEGIVVGYSRGHDDLVFRNTASGVGTGYVGEGVCADLTPGETGKHGLQFLCNDNSGNERNFWSRKIMNTSDENAHTIRTNQGSINRPADNTFDLMPGVDGQADFKVNMTNGNINYWHRPSGGNVEPQYFTPGLLNPNSVNFTPPANCENKYQNTLPIGHVSMLNVQTGAVKQYLADKKLAFGNTRYLYEQLIDGGNTNEVVQEITSTWQDDAWQLRDYLLAESPYLSVEVLREMVLQNVMPDAMVTEVCVANPEGTQQENYLEWLQFESGYPLPTYMEGMIVASWDQETYRTTLESEMALHHGEMTQAANLLLHHYRSDTVTVPLDSLKWTWQQVRTPAARYAEALVFLEEGDLDNAELVITDIPVEHELKTPESMERQRMLNFIAFLRTPIGEGRSMAELDAAEIQDLQNIVNDAYDRPAAWISNQLCFHYDICRAPLTGGEEYGTSTLPYTALEAEEDQRPELSAYPNPARAWVAFDYDLKATPNGAHLTVQDINGREVHRVALVGQEQQILWDVREVTPGTYTVVLTNEGQQLKVHKVVVR